MIDPTAVFQTRLLPSLRRPPVQLALFFVLWCAWFFWQMPGHPGQPGQPDEPLVIYCASEANLAGKILHDFTTRTGMAVAPRFETASPKSPRLTEVLMDEKDAPHGDVFWSDELLDMLRLQQRDLLLPYQGPGWARMPATCKAADGSWTGFAARLRVTIANTEKIGSTPPNLDELLPGSDHSKIAISQPLSGTTLMHYAVLWQWWGRDRLTAWHRDRRASGVQECLDNTAVKDAVATGVCYAGYTDSDEFFAAKDAGQPVTMHPVRLENGKTIALPHTVAIIRGTKHPAAARQFVDFLLSAETETALAHSPARFIPLGPVPAEQLPTEVVPLTDWARDSVDLTMLERARAECLAWLKSEHQP